MKNIFLNKISRYFLIGVCAMSFFSMMFVKKTYANDINMVRAFAGFIRHIHLNVDTVNNGNGLCVIGTDDISIQIKSLFEHSDFYRELGEEINRDRDYSECQVIYVARSKEKESKYVAQFFSDKGALTIGVFPGFVLDGGMMSIDIARRNFELSVNELAIKKSGVKIDSAITSLIVR